MTTCKVRFATAINCMDGRAQLPVNEWLRCNHGADYVDTVTEPGPVRLLAEGRDAVVESIRKRVAVSVERHGSRVIAVVAHWDCAGNPVPEPDQLCQLAKSVELVQTWYPDVTVVGLWLGSDWRVVESPSVAARRPIE